MRILGLAGIIVVAASCITMIVTAIALGHTGNCARGGPYVIANECSDADIANGLYFGLGIAGLTLGSIAVAFGYGLTAMLTVMGLGFASAGITLLIAGSSWLRVMAVIWTVLGLAFVVGCAIAVWRERVKSRETSERPAIFG